MWTRTWTPPKEWPTSTSGGEIPARLPTLPWHRYRYGPLSADSSLFPGSGGFTRSGDGGRTWRHPPGGAALPGIPDELVVDPRHGGSLYAFLFDTGFGLAQRPTFRIHRSGDRGDSWELVQSSSEWELFFPPSLPETVFLHSIDVAFDRYERSDDRGQS